MHSFAHALTNVILYLLVFRNVGCLHCNQCLMPLPACLIARLPLFSHISTFIAEHLHWFPLIARIRFKILLLTSRHSRVLLGLASRYLCDSMRRPLSAASGRSLRSLDRHDLLVPRSRTATAQHRAYASVGPLLWNYLSSTIGSVILTGGISSSSCCLKTCFIAGLFALGALLIGYYCERRLINF